MLRKRGVSAVAAFVMFLVSCVSQAQNIEELLKKCIEENAGGYIKAFVTAFGSNMQTGLYQTADVHEVLGFDITFKTMLAFAVFG